VNAIVLNKITFFFFADEGFEAVCIKFTPKCTQQGIYLFILKFLS